MTTIAKKNNGRSSKKNQRSAKDTSAPRVLKSVEGREGSMSSFARKLILEGKTNEEVFAALVKKFKVTKNHRGYPSWYRRQLVIAKLIKADFAEKHA